MKREKELVSVIIPCYNHGEYVRETLQSVLDQTYHNYEIIIVDDGSDDRHTREVLDAIDHPKVAVLRKENGHVSSARNHGIKFSRGEYLLTLDSDDQFEPAFLEKAVSILKKQPETGVVTCYAYVVDQKGGITYQHKQGGGVEAFLTVNNCLASALFRYQCWEDAGGYNESYNAITKGFEDWDFWLMVTRAGWTVYSIPEYLYKYRKALDSMSHQYKAEIPAMMKRLVQRHEDAYRENVAEVIYQKELLIKQLKDDAEASVNSLTYKVGHRLLMPFKLIRGLQKTKSLAGKNTTYNNQKNHKETCKEREVMSV